MRQLRYFLEEAWKILLRSYRISILAVTVVGLALFVAGFFLLVTHNLKKLQSQWHEGQSMTVYLKEGSSSKTGKSLEQLFSSTPFIHRWNFISQKEALHRFQDTFPTLKGVLQGLNENPLSASYEVFLEPGYEKTLPELIQKIKKIPGVEDVQYDWEWIRKLNTLVLLLRFIGLFFGLLLGVAAVVTITNVVRMATLLHEEEIHILWLVGATPSYIQAPFFLQGIYLGFLGSLFALLLLWVSYSFIIHQINRHFSLLWNFMTIGFLPFPWMIFLILAGVGCGLVGSMVSFKR